MRFAATSAITTNNPGSAVGLTARDIITVTNRMFVSDYFAWGSLVLTNTLPDGLRFLPGHPHHVVARHLARVRRLVDVGPHNFVRYADLHEQLPPSR